MFYVCCYESFKHQMLNLLLCLMHNLENLSRHFLLKVLAWDVKSVILIVSIIFFFLPPLPFPTRRFEWRFYFENPVNYSSAWLLPRLTRRAPAADFACVAPPGSSRDSDPTLAVWVRSFDQGSRRQKKPDADLHGDMPVCKRTWDTATNWPMVARQNKLLQETRRGTFASEVCTSRGKYRNTEKPHVSWGSGTDMHAVAVKRGKTALCSWWHRVSSGKNVLVFLSQCFFYFFFIKKYIRTTDDHIV